MSLPTLAISGYVLPGAYLGRLTIPQPAGTAGITRQPCFLGQGSRLMWEKNQRLVRSFITGEQLSFSGITFTSPLQFHADGNQAVALLYKQDNTPVPVTKWSFATFSGGGYTQVVIASDIFDASATYFLNYQSTDRTPKDPLPFNDLRQIYFVGDNQSQQKYKEGVDYFVDYTVTQPVAATANLDKNPSTTAIIPGVGNTGSGGVAADASNAPTYQYNRHYLLTVLSHSAAGPAIVTTSGNALPFSNLASKTLRVDVSTDGGLTFPTTVTHTFGAGPYNTVASVLAEIGSGGSDAAFIAVAVASAGSGNEIVLTSVATGYLVRLKVDGASTGIAGAGLLEFTAGQTGAGVGRTVHFQMTAVALGGGNNTVPDQTVANSNAYTFTVTESSTLNPTSLGWGIVMDFTFGLTNYANGDTFAFDLLGGARFELQDTLSNTNQFAALTTPAAVALTQPAPPANTGTGTVVAGSSAAYTGVDNRRYEVSCTATGGVSPNRTATLVWRAIGSQLPATNGSISLTETPNNLSNVLLELGVRLTFGFGATNFAVGDTFSFTALAPRMLYTAKDDRTVTVTVSASVGGATPTVTYAWVGNTIEAGFGSDTAIQQDVPVLTRSNLYLIARNLITTAQTAYMTVGDKFTFTAASADTMDWSLVQQKTETISASSIRFDQTGAVTGTAGLYYVALQFAPSTIISVINAQSLVPITYTSIIDANGNPTSYIAFATNPGVSIAVSYLFTGNQPEPGQSYYVTATALRPDSKYDTPIQTLNKDDADVKLGPMEPGNHVLIATLLGFEQGMPSGWAVQAQDRNGDGVLDPIDFQLAIDGSQTQGKITDLIVLAGFSSIGYAFNSTVQMNDPFKRKPRMDWVGAPINTPVGDSNTANTLIFTATQVLQVFGNSPAHGKFVMVGNTWCKVTVLLPDQSTLQLTLDGSFVAAALAALVSSFPDPSTTPLKKTLNGFDDMDAPDEDDLKLLGAAGISTAQVIGAAPAAVFRMAESLTTDPDPTFSEISYMTQDEAVVRTVNNDVEQVVGFVTPTNQEGADQVGNVLFLSLARLAGNLVAPYQDANGNVRKISRQTDIVVARDPVNKTRYNYLFSYFRKNPIKVVSGLYVTDVPDVTTIVANS